ncbi:MAG: PDDEXK nuclease domain-containing protein [Prevotellaceae bacterium]|jgi:predicted nuclease of restriction endonuclease-like (RecB) superfamily|nr:PDDEXK nuclease domain-containing protein [Prevotellaceae bacterium]
MSKAEAYLYRQIADLLLQARKITARAVNQTMVYTYYEIGRMIVEDEQRGAHRAEYGKQVLKELSAQLTKDFGKGFSERNLEQMRGFYLTYSQNQISQTASAKLQISDGKGNATIQATPEELPLVPDFRLSWSHYLKLMRIENKEERNFYEIESINNNWSLRELQRQFDSALYERLALSRDKEKVKELSTKGQILEAPRDIIKDPLVLEFLGLPELAAFSETELEQSIINKIENFLLELGKGFTFVGRQVRFTFDEKHFKVDLVFYNRLLKCFVLIDLKIGELTHQDLGQLQMYVNYYDRFVRLSDENKTIGIILCKEKNDTLVEITLPQDNTQLFASKYQTVLPSKEELRQLIESKKW